MAGELSKLPSDTARFVGKRGVQLQFSSKMPRSKENRKKAASDQNFKHISSSQLRMKLAQASLRTLSQDRTKGHKEIQKQMERIANQFADEYD